MLVLTALGMAFTSFGLIMGHGLPFIGAVLLLLAATAGIMHALFSRRHLLILLEQIRQPMQGSEFRRLNSPARDFDDIAQAINELLVNAAGTVSDAAIKAKE